MVFTNDAALAAEVRKIVNHGQSKRYHHARLGLNARLDTLQAALLLAKLDDYLGQAPGKAGTSHTSGEQETVLVPGEAEIPRSASDADLPPGPTQRNQVAAAYAESLQPLADKGLLKLPAPPRPPSEWWRKLQLARENPQVERKLQPACPPQADPPPSPPTPETRHPPPLSAWSQYSIQFLHGPAPETRDAAAEHLGKRGIPTAVHYPVPLHQQPVFAGLGYKPGDFPVAESVSQRILSLPFDALKTPEEIHRVTAALMDFFIQYRTSIGDRK